MATCQGLISPDPIVSEVSSGFGGCQMVTALEVRKGLQGQAVGERTLRCPSPFPRPLADAPMPKDFASLALIIAPER